MLPAYTTEGRIGRSGDNEGKRRTDNRPLALDPKTLEGLLIMTLTEQFPAAADADNTMITLPVDRMLQDEAAAEHTVAVQV